MKIRFNVRSFEDIRRSPAVEARLQSEVDKVTSRLAGAPGNYASGVEAGRSRSRGFVVTTDGDSIRDNANHHTLLRALGGGL